MFCLPACAGAKLREMATKKKTKKKSSTTKRTARKRATPARKKKAVKRPKPLVRKKSVPKSTKKARVMPAKKQTRKGSRRAGSQEFSVKSPGSQSGEQSGDLQGLSRREGADSESVRELLEEGNAFEADVVAGVERGDDGDAKEVRTHEVPEDDVPDEYLDED